jgi:hypothetical protein
MIARRVREQPDPDVVFVIEPNQNPFESYALGAALVVSAAAYAAVLLTPALGTIAAALVSLPLVMVVIQVAFVGFGLLFTALFRREDKRPIMSAFVMTLMFVASLWALSTDSWARYIAVALFTGAALNVVAAAILWICREQVQAVNRARGVPE